MPLQKAAWLITVLICLLTAALLFAAGYIGYGAVVLVVAAAAAVNLN